jgi:hypothetical protein
MFLKRNEKIYETGKYFLKYVKVSVFITILGYFILFVSISLFEAIGLTNKIYLTTLHIALFIVLNMLSYLLHSGLVFDVKLKFQIAKRFFCVSIISTLVIYITLPFALGIFQNIYIASFIIFTILGTCNFIFHKCYTFSKP